MFPPFIAPTYPPTGAFFWIIEKLIHALPVVVAPKAISLLEETLSPTTPPWRRAILASVLMELLAVVNLSIPAGAALRMMLLATLFQADRRGGNGPDKAPASPPEV